MAPPDRIEEHLERYLTKLPAYAREKVAYQVPIFFEQKKAEEALRESEEYLRLVIDLLPEMIFAKDSEGRFILANRAVADAYGSTVDDLTGRLHSEFHVEEEELQHMLQDDLEVIESGREKFILEQSFQDHAGNVRFLQTKKVPLSVPGKSERAILGIATDITERKRVEEALRVERERAQMYLDLAGVMFVALDATDTVTLVNRKTCELLGYAKEELVGRNWFDTCLPQRLRESVKEVSKQILRGVIEPVEYYENPVLTKTGEERLIAWHNTVLRDNEGAIIGHLSSGDDITERKRAEEALLQEKEKLQEALDNIKTLKGLLPICAECKKIRDDKGYWKQIEGYIETHSDASFSHGLCPECMDKIYGNEDWYKKEDFDQ